MINITYTMPPARRLLLLALLFVAGLSIAGIAGGMLMSMASPARLLAMTRIATVIQDVLMLVVPAVATAMLVTRRPAQLLAVDTTPPATYYLAAVAGLIFASPLMSAIIEWNTSLHLPASMQALEASLRAMEERAGGAVEFMLGPATAGNLVVSLLLVGVLAGVSEELFFRGALQRLIASTGMSAAGAVWVTALVFSAVHMQPFGLVPRLLLGAYLGYLLVWSGSVWVPVTEHTLNNSLYVVMRYATGSGESEYGSGSPVVLIASAVLTGAMLVWMYRNRNKKSENQ